MTPILRTISLTFAMLLLAVTAAAALEPVNQNRAGVAIEGHDPVAYFVDGAPRQGQSELSYEWNGATWLFASAENRKRFVAEPERYAPQYGGYCAWAVSENSVAGIDPSVWRIVDGKLYLNYSKKIGKRWAEDIPGRIARADANWPRLLAEE